MSDNPRMRTLAIALLLIACTRDRADRPSPPQPQTAAPPAAKTIPAQPDAAPDPDKPSEADLERDLEREPDEVISAPALLREYVDNPLAADHRHKGKRVRLYGYVTGF